MGNTSSSLKSYVQMIQTKKVGNSFYLHLTLYSIALVCSTTKGPQGLFLIMYHFAQKCIGARHSMAARRAAAAPRLTPPPVVALEKAVRRPRGQPRTLNLEIRTIKENIAEPCQNSYSRGEKKTLGLHWKLGRRSFKTGPKGLIHNLYTLV